MQPAPGAPEGEAKLLAFRSQGQEANGVAALIKHLIDDEHVAPNDILWSLTRGDNNSVFSRPIKERLDESGIPVDDPARVERILEENRAPFLLLRLIDSPKDSLAWAGLLKLTNGVSDGFRQELYVKANNASVTFAEALMQARDEEFPDASGRGRNAATALIEQVEGWLQGHAPPEEKPDPGWGAWLAAQLDDEPLYPITDELRGLLQDVDDLVEEDLELRRFLSQLIPLAKDQAAAQGEGVRFMTMNSSKGLTVQATILLGAEDQLIPSPKGELEEERRLVYVAMTRARRYMYATWATRRTGPTARAGQPRVAERRAVTRFLTHGPIGSQDGWDYIAERWPHTSAAA